MTELQRLRQVIALQGEDRMREWARNIASIYLGLTKNPQHHASQPEWKLIFERNARALNHFANTEVFPSELEEPVSMPRPIHSLKREPAQSARVDARIAEQRSDDRRSHVTGCWILRSR